VSLCSCGINDPSPTMHIRLNKRTVFGQSVTNLKNVSAGVAGVFIALSMDFNIRRMPLIPTPKKSVTVSNLAGEGHVNEREKC